jgi:hypothetical protein
MHGFLIKHLSATEKHDKFYLKAIIVGFYGENQLFMPLHSPKIKLQIDIVSKKFLQKIKA